MNYFRRFFIWLCLPLLCSSCYDMHIELGNRTFYTNQATNRYDLQICPLKNIKIHCSIIGGLDFDSDRKEFVGTLVDYQIRIQRSDGHEYTPFQGTTRSNFEKDWNIIGIPPGVGRGNLPYVFLGLWEY